jgi:hypothetical protein
MLAFIYKTLFNETSKMLSSKKLNPVKAKSLQIIAMGMQDKPDVIVKASYVDLGIRFFLVFLSNSKVGLNVTAVTRPIMFINKQIAKIAALVMRTDSCV